MKPINRISASAFLAAASMTYCASAWSLGLGDAKVESFLNQPLKARIDLITQDTDDLASVTVKLASAADYELIGASLEAVPVPIQFAIEDIDSDAYLTASSRLPINSPVIRLIVEVNWSSGRMLREYTLFLDPASVPSVAPAPPMEKARAVEEISQSGVEPVAPPVQAAPRSEPVHVPGASEYGPVQGGETLWAIARDWSQDTGLNLNKVMIAIQRENPSAFLNNNINLLKRGAILRMPEADAIRQISADSANSEVELQADEFSGRKARESAASTSTPLLAEEAAIPEQAIPEQSQVEPVDMAAAEAEPALSGEDPSVAEDIAAEDGEAESPVETAADDSDAASQPESRDQLELVPPSAQSELDSAYGFEETDESGEAVAAVQTLREDLARTEEDLYTQQRQNEYLEQRIQELEAQVADSDKGTVADADLANMEERLRQDRQAQAKADSEPEAWYSRFSYWLIGLLVLVVGAIGWWISRRGDGGEAAAIAGTDDDSIREIKDEAEEVLRVLDDSTEEDAQGAPEEPEEAATEIEKNVKKFGDMDDDAELLDQDSSDPEIQLDLARAYISMGDREAARVILDEVVSNGSEGQQAEAKKMLDLL